MADYAISNVARRVVYANTGVGPYAFTFEILANTDIAVYRGSTLLTLTTDYSVTINSNGTGSVTLVTAGTGNITIVGARAIQRTSDYTTGGDLFASTLNTDLDSQTIYVQQVAETAERGLKAPVVDPTDINMTLPSKTDRAGTFLAFDSPSGNPIAGPSIASVGTVTQNIANINTVATNIASVNTVAGNTANINTVAGVSGNVTTVAGSISNVNTVADDLNEPVSEINTVATDIANVNAVGNNIANVNSVAGNETNINAVVSNATNINAVAGNASNINTVATNNANVTTVATNIASVNTNATNIANINQNAANITAIQNASANATAAANSATAAAASATSASNSAAAASAVALGNEPVRHSVRPSLLLDFANTETLDPRITFTRASTATFYDGRTVAKAEENLFTFSEQFDNAAWGKNNLTVTANNTTAPDGNTTAELITLTASTSAKNLNQAVASSNPFVFSVYAKAGTHSFIQLLVQTGGAGHVNFDLTNGTLSATTATGTITSVGNGWYRCTMSLTGTAATIAYISPVTSLSAVRNESWTAAGTETVFLWGAQLEQRSSVTAYTATTTAPITNYIPALQTAASGVARFEHNPVTGESLGLEIEEQRTNLFTYSEQFDNAAWGKTNTSITANAIIAPDGTLTGDRVVENTSVNIAHQVTQSPTGGTAGLVYTFSMYMKAAGRNFGYLQLADGSSPNKRFGAVFDLASGVVGSTFTANSPTATSSTITAVGNGWYRCTISMTQTAGTTVNTGFATSDSSSPTVNASIYPIYTGDGWSGVFIWGAQVEAGAFATSYIPTVASQVTRSADSASMTGTNFSSWYRADEGTVYIDALTTRPTSDGNDSVAFSINDGTSGNRIQSNWDTVAHLYVQTNSSVQVNIDLGSVTTNSFDKIACVYKVNDFAASLNGGTVSTDTAGLIPVVSQINIGNHLTGSYLGGTIKKLAYYPKRLTNAELQGLTTV